MLADDGAVEPQLEWQAPAGAGEEAEGEAHLEDVQQEHAANADEKEPRRGLLYLGVEVNACMYRE